MLDAHTRGPTEADIEAIARRESEGWLKALRGAREELSANDETALRTAFKFAIRKALSLANPEAT